jgi:hypothetical protein
LSVQHPEEVKSQTNWYCILFVVTGIVTGLGMFLQVLNIRSSVALYLIFIASSIQEDGN